MSEEKHQDSALEELYDDSYWHVNTGGETIHAKRMGGKWRNIKWWATIPPPVPTLLLAVGLFAYRHRREKMVLSERQLVGAQA